MSAGETDDTFANECLGPEYSCCSFPLRHDGVVITSTLVEERGIFLERGPEEEGGGGARTLTRIEESVLARVAFIMTTVSTPATMLSQERRKKEKRDLTD